MTHLEELIQRHVESATVTTMSNATEKIAEEMAREILKDPEFRAEMRTLIRGLFKNTMTALNEEANGRRRRRTRRTRRTKGVGNND
jgi:hypothetical protein